jgi:hypothetical protein
MHTITRKWAHEWCTKPPAGWTAAQLRVLGVAWPPKKGWLSALRGKTIPDEQARQFERLSGHIEPLPTGKGD